MSNYIVLVKQVPDVTQITDNAFDPETGTLIRTRLPSVINELDSQALALANRMRMDSGNGDGKIIVLTMGPPMAEEVLRYSLSRCADTAILLTDRALGGADTWATANPLAYAIRKIAKDIFKGSDDYYVVSGMQSVDGDTAQVPPQIAEELSVPCIAYVTKAEHRKGRFEFTRIISGGSQVVAAKKLPAVVTVAKYEYPVFATFAGTRKANGLEVICWSGDDIKAPYIGAKGSKTRVMRVFPPPKSKRKCIQLEGVQSLAGQIVDCFKDGKGQAGDSGEAQISRYILPAKRKDKFDRSFEGTSKEKESFEILAHTLRGLGIDDVGRIDEYMKEKILAEAEEHFHKKALENMLEGLQLTKPSYEGEVWVVAEHDGEAIHPSTFELVGKARDLADSLETKVGVCLAGYKVEPMAKELIAAGADNIYVIE
ncbi:MAG: electron transfer flavoprotein subunit beta, partial [Planctomycetota bacterium]